VSVPAFVAIAQPVKVKPNANGGDGIGSVAQVGVMKFCALAMFMCMSTRQILPVTRQ
tara:strand:- start:432 stop:602 length:171 start_codon:yes stop_codon:yes gene_type:complete